MSYWLAFVPKVLNMLSILKCNNYVLAIGLFRAFPSNKIFPLDDFVCLYTYEFWLSLCKIARSSVILLLPLWFDFQQLIHVTYFKNVSFFYKFSSSKTSQTSTLRYIWLHMNSKVDYRGYNGSYAFRSLNANSAIFQLYHGDKKNFNFFFYISLKFSKFS
jgi:hypothetical protein